jgi:hypothetical protein
MLASLRDSLEQTKGLRMCVRKRERERNKKGAAEWSDLTGI